ncbi:MAG TPA: hypothetical protein VFC46_02365 [Humisphaera sp.]|nr:hypothetical protein [Humisphaera sp.]
MSDRLAKSFDRHLAIALDIDKDARRRLMRRGWKEFVNSEHPDTNSPAEMASHAVLYLGTHNGQWSKEPKLIIAALAFLKDETKQGPKLDIKTLVPLLGESPVNHDKIHHWFAESFP